MIQKKIVFFTNTLTAGGAERVMTNMANYLADGEFKVYLVTTANTEDFYDLHQSIIRVALDDVTTDLPLFFKWFRFIKRFYRFRSFLRNEKPAVVISFLENVNILNCLACLLTPVKSIISVRNDPRKNKVGLLLSFLRKLLYPLANCLVLQTRDVESWARGRSLNKNIRVIPNSIRIPLFTKNQVCLESEIIKIISVGRLVPQKGFDLLIEAMSLVVEQESKVRLDIYGEGPLLDLLKKKACGLNLQGKIFFRGLSSNLSEKLVESDIFVLSSRYEGFPNVLLESMSLGVPSVSFNCQSGPSDIINHNEDGLLVPDGNIQKLSESILYLIKREDVRIKFNKTSVNNLKRYEISKVMELWKELF